MNPFLLTPAPAFGIPVCRLGLASYGATNLTPDDLYQALGRGVNFLNWAGHAEGPTDAEAYSTAIAGLGAARSSVVVCAQFGARSAADAATELRGLLAALGTDYIDVLTIYYVETPKNGPTLPPPAAPSATCGTPSATARCGGSA